MWCFTNQQEYLFPSRIHQTLWCKGHISQQDASALRICWTWRHWHLSWLLLLDFEMQWSIMTINPMSIAILKYPVELCINRCHERITREPPWPRLRWVYFNLIAYIRTFFNTYIWIWWPHTCNFIVGRPDRIINWSYTMDNSATRWRKFNKLLCGRIANVTVMFQMSITEAGTT